MNDLPWNLRATTAPLGIAGRVSDAKQIRDAGGIRLHICPATGNAPTRMTWASWKRLCAATQRRSLERECIDKNQAQLMRMTRRLNVCAWCRGKILPRGLEFIDAAEMAAMIKPKEEAMAKQSKLGNCDNCGERAALTGSFGRRVCSTCLKIRSNVNSHLPKIATAARDMGKGPELLAALVPDGGGLAIQVTADLLQDIAGLVDYQGEDPAELVEAVRRRALACASCDAEDVLAEIREIVGYSPDMGDSGLADAVRASAAAVPAEQSDLDQQWIDLMRACGLEDDGGCRDWGWAAAAAIQTIAELINRQDDLLTKERVNNASLRSALRGDLDRSTRVIEELRAELALAEQSRDEWEQRAVQAEANVADQAAELYADDTNLRDELTCTGAEVERLRDRAQESESRLIWYREALAVLRYRLGLDHLGEDEDVVERMLEAIASQAQALTRFQELARAADVRADEVEAELAQARSEIEGLRDYLASAEAVAAQKLWEPGLAPTVEISTWGDESLLAEFGRRVLRGEVAVSFQGVRP